MPSRTEQQWSGFISHVFEISTPEMIKCFDDEKAFHVPESVKQKIQRHEFVNLAVLLKGRGGWSSWQISMVATF